MSGNANEMKDRWGSERQWQPDEREMGAYGFSTLAGSLRVKLGAQQQMGNVSAELKAEGRTSKFLPKNHLWNNGELFSTGRDGVPHVRCCNIRSETS